MLFQKKPPITNKQVDQMTIEAHRLSQKANELIATLNGEDNWFLAVCKKEKESISPLGKINAYNE